MTARQRNEAFVRLRRSAGLTQRRLVAEYAVTAQRIGVRGTVSERTVARWESADPPCPGQVSAWLERIDSAKVHARLREFRTRAVATDARCAVETVERIDAALAARP